MFLPLFVTKPSSGYTFANAEAQAICDAFASAPTNARKLLIDTWVGALKSGVVSSSNVFATLDHVQFFAAADAQAAGINWITPGSNTASLVNNPTFTADRGYNGNGTNSYVNTGFIPANGTQIAQNSASISVWSRTAGQLNFSNGGITGTTKGLSISPRNASNQFSGRVNDTGGTIVGTVTDGTGLFSMIRTGASAVVGYRNATQIGTGSTASVGLPTHPMFVSAYNNNGAASSFHNRQYAMVAFGAARTADQETDFFNATQALLQAIGAA